jgi:hypothetical protein
MRKKEKYPVRVDGAKEVGGMCEVGAKLRAPPN